MQRKPFKFAPEQKPTRRETVSPVVSETTVFNMVSDNVLINGLSIAGSVAASLVVIASTLRHFFA